MSQEEKIVQLKKLGNRRVVVGWEGFDAVKAVKKCAEIKSSDSHLVLPSDNHLSGYHIGMLVLNDEDASGEWMAQHGLRNLFRRGKHANLGGGFKRPAQSVVAG